MLYEVLLNTPYTRGRRVVNSPSLQLTKEWAVSQLTDFLEENEEEVFEEFLSGEMKEDFYDSALYDWYVESSDYEIYPYSEDELDEDDEVYDITNQKNN